MTTTIELPSSVVIKLCQNKLFQIKEQRAAGWALQINAEIENRNWWRRWLPWLSPLSEDDARDKLTAAAMLHFSYTPDHLFADQETRVQNLLDLANREPDGRIYLSAKDNKELQ